MIFIFKKYKKQIITGIVFLVLIILIIIIKIIDNNKKNEETFISNVIPNTEAIEKESETEENNIVIHITGAVVNQGIIEIPDGSRIADAIEKAGGLTAEANLKDVNLAYALEDGQKLYIPNLADENVEEYVEDGVSGDVVIDSFNTSDDTININKATVEELQDLNGIGEAIATAIVQYRTENGNFNSIEDIKNVPGIGENKFENIKDFIDVK